MDTRTNKPPVDLTNKRVVQVGIIAADVVTMAKRYAEVLGIGPWVFADLSDNSMTDMVYRDQQMPDDSVRLRIALADYGNLQIELIQPLLNDPTMYTAFLTKAGNGGVHHVSFGMVDDHDVMASALTATGTNTEMQGHLGREVRFTFWDTTERLGTTFEALNVLVKEITFFVPWGKYEPISPGFINPECRRFQAIGLVVQDAERTAQNYADCFGVGPWTVFDLNPQQLAECSLHGIPMIGKQSHLKVASADFGGIRFDLIEPVKGPSSHMDFLMKHGQGIHHLSFGECNDFDRLVSALTDNGIAVEMSGVAGGATRFAYFATQEDLGALLAMTNTSAMVPSTLAPCGTIPPHAQRS